MYTLSPISASRLAGVHPDLIKIVKRAISISLQDFMVIEGVRTKERQEILYAQGRTTPGEIVTKTMVSKHRIQTDGFGHAVDIAPFPLDWKDTAKFDKISKAMFQAARELNVPIRWGADWDEDGKPRERGETDSPHFELAK